MWEEGKSPFTLVLGLIVVAFGVIPLLNNLGVIGFNLPGIITGNPAANIIFTIVGLFLIVDAFMF